jgi:mono/diheme cytochrome c family protein
MKKRLALAALAASLLAPAPAAWAQDIDLGSEQDRAEGERLYAQYCSQCHGDDGDGVGIATPYLRPAPRDFTSGKYRIRSTPVGYLPTDENLHRSIRDGIPGTGMPGFATDLSEDEIAQVTHYLKTFSADFEDPSAYGEVIPIPDPPPFDPESLETGAGHPALDAAPARSAATAGCDAAPGRSDDAGLERRGAPRHTPATSATRLVLRPRGRDGVRCADRGRQCRLERIDGATRTTGRPRARRRDRTDHAIGASPRTRTDTSSSHAG